MISSGIARHFDVASLLSIFALSFELQQIARYRHTSVASHPNTRSAHVKSENHTPEDKTAPRLKINFHRTSCSLAAVARGSHISPPHPFSRLYMYTSIIICESPSVMKFSNIVWRVDTYSRSPKAKRWTMKWTACGVGVR